MDFQALDPQIARQKALVEQLRGSQQEIDENNGRMVGRYFVRQPMLSQAVSGLVGGLTTQRQQGVDDLETQKRRQVQDAQQQWVSQLPQAVAGQKEQQGPQAQGGSPELAAIPAQPVTTAQILKHTLAGMQIPGNEKTATTYNAGAIGDLQREDTQAFRSFEANATRESAETLKREQIAANNEIQRQILAQREADSRQRSADMRLSIQQRAGAASEANETRRQIAQLVAGTKGKGTKPLPSAQSKAFIENETALGKIDRASKFLEENPKAFGLKNFGPDWAVQRMDQGGVSARAAIADIGSLKIHDRSGAAVSASEDQRLKPFVPLATDRPETIKKKLENFVAEYEMIQQEIANYADDQGYNAPVSRRVKPGGAATPSTPSPDAPVAPVASPGGAVSPGTVKSIGGKNYVFDGKGWMAQ